jgi:hypothetical protein
MNASWTKKECTYLQKHYALMPTPEKMKLLRELYPNTKNADIAQILGVTEYSIIAAGFRYKLRKTAEFKRQCSEKGMYKKGQQPFNKGLNGKEYLSAEALAGMKATQFKKGTVPPNHKPAGYERVCAKDGYIYVKVAEGMKQFRLKHRVIYEQHFGSIPKGYNVQFKDGNIRNFSPDNLELVSKKQNLQRNTVHNYPEEIVLMVHLRGVLNRQINKHKKIVSNEK